MQLVNPTGSAPTRWWAAIATAAVITGACIVYGNPVALLIACALWMCVVSEWYCAPPVRAPRSRAFMVCGTRR